MSFEWVQAHYLDPRAHDDWPYSRTDKGYAQTAHGGTVLLAHSVACALAHGPRPAGLYAIHSCSCRNRHCFWAEHLSWGTPQRNQADRLRDGTHNRGTRHGMHKLTEDQVLAIRKRAAENHTHLAVEYEVTPTTVRHILGRRTWAWL